MRPTLQWPLGITMMMADEEHVSVRERTSSKEGDIFVVGGSSCEGGIPEIETEGVPETYSATRASVPIVDFVGWLEFLRV
jgi:hypothetical protein